MRAIEMSAAVAIAADGGLVDVTSHKVEQSKYQTINITFPHNAKSSLPDTFLYTGIIFEYSNSCFSLLAFVDLLKTSIKCNVFFSRFLAFHTGGKFPTLSPSLPLLRTHIKKTSHL